MLGLIQQSTSVLCLYWHAKQTRFSSNSSVQKKKHNSDEFPDSTASSTNQKLVLDMPGHIAQYYRYFNIT